MCIVYCRRSGPAGYAHRKNSSELGQRTCVGQQYIRERDDKNKTTDVIYDYCRMSAYKMKQKLYFNFLNLYAM